MEPLCKMLFHDASFVSLFSVPAALQLHSTLLQLLKYL